jgi:hypothetical protein
MLTFYRVVFLHLIFEKKNRERNIVFLCSQQKGYNAPCMQDGYKTEAVASKRLKTCCVIFILIWTVTGVTLGRMNRRILEYKMVRTCQRF